MSRINVFLLGAGLAAGTLFTLAPAPARAAGVYFVKEGDTLYGISRLFGTDLARLREINNLKGSAISPGDRIRIPESTASRRGAPGSGNAKRVRQVFCREDRVYHTVLRGETLTAISRRYGTTLQALLALNGLKSRARLSIGQRLVVRRNGPRTHSVRPGEDLAAIAAGYRIDVADLRRFNDFDAETLQAGQQVLLESCDPLAAAGGTPPPLGDSRPDLSSNVGRIIDIAKTMLGIPYRFGGTTLGGLDCSAYVQRVFGLIDVAVPRTAREQYLVGARIARDQLVAGDLVFFRTYASFPSHVGIYLGEELFIHASSIDRRVTIDSLDQSFYRRRFIGARRVLAEPVSALAVSP